MTDEHRTIRARRLAARDALGIPRSPRAWDYGIPEDRALKAQRAQARLIVRGFYTYACPFVGLPVHGPLTRGQDTFGPRPGRTHGWDAVPDTRDVRPERCGECNGTGRLTFGEPDCDFPHGGPDVDCDVCGGAGR